MASGENRKISFTGDSVTQAGDYEMGFKCRRLPYDPGGIICIYTYRSYNAHGCKLRYTKHTNGSKVKTS